MKTKSITGNYWRYLTSMDITAALFSECLLGIFDCLKLDD